MKKAENFTVSLYLSNLLWIKISTLETIPTSCFILIHAYFWKIAVYEMTKPLTYLMKLVNLDTTRQMTSQEKENEVLYNLTCILLNYNFTVK
jgi:hypothetical protein